MEGADDAYERLAFQLDADRAFWFAAVVGNNLAARRALRERARERAASLGIPFHEHAVAPVELRRVVHEVVRAATPGVHWLRAATEGDVAAVDRGIAAALGALNERREECRRALRGPLIIEGRESLRRRLREVAPDLFSIAAFVAEVDGEEEPATDEGGDPFFEEMLRAWRLRLDAASFAHDLRQVVGVAPFRRVAVVTPRDDAGRPREILAACAGTPTREQLVRFAEESVLPRRRVDPWTRVTVVHGDEAPDEATRRFAQDEHLTLVAASAFRRLIDFTDHVRRQREVLASDADPDYPPRRYVPQRMTWRTGGDDASTEDALQELTGRVLSRVGGLSLVLADFGTGKTFLTRQLALRLSERADVVPLRVNLRGLNKARSLDELLGQHMIRHGFLHPHVAALRYMMEAGSVALLFDGFDELALRVRYDEAADYLDTLLDAVRGRCHVVITSRTQHFRDANQVEKALARHLDAVRGQIFVLEKFDEARIRRFVRAELEEAHDARSDALSAEVERRLELMRDIRDLGGLAETPRMLGMIMKLDVRDLEDVRARKGSITAADLYQRLTDHWLTHEWRRSNPQGEKPGLPMEKRLEFVKRFARRVWRERDGGVSLDVLREEAARVARGTGLDDERAAQECGASTVLRRDEEGRFSFFHPSVMEYFVAVDAAEELLAAGTTETLGEAELSPLSARFFIDIVGVARAVRWATTIPRGEGHARANAVRVQTMVGAGASGVVDFSGQDLRELDLSALKDGLAGAKLSKCNLAGVSLRGFTLKGADLQGATLVGADLTHADLTHADLRGADLSRARLLGARLRGAKLEGAVLRAVALLGAEVDADVEQRAVSAGGTPAAGATVLHQSAGALRGAVVGVSPRAEVMLIAQRDWSAWVDLRRGGLIRRWWMPGAGATALPTFVRFSHDGELAAVGDAMGRAWLCAVDRANQRPWQPRAIHGAGELVTHVAFHPRRLWMAIASFPNHIVVGVPGGRAFDAELSISTGAQVLGLAFSDDGRRIEALASGGSVHRWSVGDWSSLGVVQLTRRGAPGFWFSPGGRFIAERGADGAVYVFDQDTRLTDRLEGHAVVQVIGSHDGAYIAGLTDEGRICVWPPQRSRGAVVLPNVASRNARLFWCGERPWIAVRDDNAVVILDALDGRELASVAVFDDGWAVSRADGRYRAAGGLHGQFWHQINECRFEAGELDAFLDLRLRDDENLLDVP